MKKKENQVIIWRIVLGILIVCNMIVIFLFSSQNGIKSALVSKKVTVNVVGMIPNFFLEMTTTTRYSDGETLSTPAEITTPTKPETTTPEETTPKETTTPTKPETTTPEETTPKETTPNENTTEKKPNKKDPEKELSQEQQALVKKMHTPIRKLAHMLEFGSLATLAFLLLLTWAGKILWRYAAALGFSFVYAATDELHQLFQDGRGARFSDVLIDFSGAFIACTILLAIVIAIRYKKGLVTANGEQPTKNQNKNPIIRISSYISSIFQKLNKKKRGSEPESEKTTEEELLPKE